MAGVANQDNRGGRTGVCAPRTSLPANVYSRLYLMDLSLEYGTVTVVVHGSGSDDTTYPPDGAANQDNRSGRTGVVLHGLVFLLMSTHSHSILEDDDNTDSTLVSLHIVSIIVSPSRQSI